MEEQLCECTNCELIMYDENPNDQPKLIPPSNVRSMERFINYDGEYWGCPSCGTDEYLVDLYHLK